MNLRIVYAAPGKPAEERTIPHTLRALQTAVGGYIEAYSPEPFTPRGLLLYVHEDGMRDERNRLVGGLWIRGPIVVVRVAGEDEYDLTDDDVAFAIGVLDGVRRVAFS